MAEVGEFELEQMAVLGALQGLARVGGGLGRVSGGLSRLSSLGARRGAWAARRAGARIRVSAAFWRAFANHAPAGTQRFVVRTG